MTGHWKHAHDYHMRAKCVFLHDYKLETLLRDEFPSSLRPTRNRKLMAELFDDSSALVAAAHSLFAYHYGSLGELEKAAFANSMAIRITEHLIRTKPNMKSVDGIHVATLYLHCLVVELDFIPARYRRLYCRILLCFCLIATILATGRSKTSLSGGF
jgi:hypothetical protein